MEPQICVSGTHADAKITCERELEEKTIAEDIKNEREELVSKLTCSDCKRGKEDQVIEKTDVLTCEIKSLRGPGEFTFKQNCDVEELDVEKKEDLLFVSAKRDAEDPLNKVIEPTVEIKKRKEESEMDTKVDAQNREGSVEMETIENLIEGRNSLKGLEKDEKNREEINSSRKEERISTEYEEERGIVVKSEAQKVMAASGLEEPNEVRHGEESVTNLQEATGNHSKDIFTSQNHRNETVFFEKEDKAVANGKGNDGKEEDKEEDNDDIFDGSEGFDVHFFSNDICKQMKNEDISAEKLLHSSNSKGRLEDVTLKRPVAEDENTYDVIRDELHGKLAYLLMYLLTYLLTCLLTFLPTHILTYILIFLLTYLHAYLHTFILTHIHTCIHTCLLICLLTYLLTCLLTYLLTYLLIYLLTYLLTCLLTYIVDAKSIVQDQIVEATTSIDYSDAKFYDDEWNRPGNPDSFAKVCANAIDITREKERFRAWAKFWQKYTIVSARINFIILLPIK